MLKVKNLTHLSKKKMEKGGNFYHSCNLVSRFGLILTNILFSIEWA